MKKPDLGKPENTIFILQKYNFRFRKRYGQNFLIDTHVLDKIIKAADIGKEDTVIEIGPGIGTLTQYLAYYGKKVVAIEIDKTLLPILDETLAAYENVEIICKDVLKTDLKGILKDTPQNNIKIVANLPYYITTPIIMKFFEEHIPMDSMVIMVQEEVAKRMQASPGTKDYGALSLAIQYYAKPYIAAYVPRNCFMPRPNVGSAVISLKRHKKPPFEVADDALLFALIHASFQQRRKTLVNGLHNSTAISFSKEEIKKAIISLGKGERIRGEDLCLEEFVLLTNKLMKN